MPPKDRRKKKPEDYHLLASQRGFRWLGPEVPSTKTLTNWECPNKHQWKAIYNNIQQGRDCPKCARKKKPVDYQLLAKQRSIEWLGPYVTKYFSPTKWKCKNGHEWFASYREILRGDACLICRENKVIHIASESDEDEVNIDLNPNIKRNYKAKLVSNRGEKDILLDWWGKKSISLLEPLFASAKKQIRLSTGFFSIQGYNLIKEHVQNKYVDILVGYDDRSRYEAKMTLVDEIMDDLGRWHDNRREAVLNLIHKLENREFRIVDARLRQKDHSKIYIFDDKFVASGSTNLTNNGLQLNQEGDLVITEKESKDRIKWWIKQYKNYWNASDTEDVSETLLKRLRAWLGLYKPWNIYLKTIQALAPESNALIPRENYKIPSEYQMIVVDRALRQLDNYRGAMVVASTGLGKTIIATHIAYKLVHHEQKILNVLVVAPKPVKDEWQKRLRSAGVPVSIHTRNLLDMPPKEENNQKALNDLLEALDEVDEKWLIIIDESQYFKNREKGEGGERLSFSRLIDAINEKKCLVLLLTATPYSTEVDNINHQLLLLPHTNPKEIPHQRSIPGLEPGKLYLHSWKVNRVEDLVDLPVGTVINTPYVAQNFALQSKEGDYLLFGDKKKYIPRIHVSKINVPVIVEELMTNALDNGYFKHNPIQYKTRDGWARSQAGAENEAAISWGSSPWALREVINKTINEENGYEYPFIYTREEREKELKPILDALSKMRYEDDEKFMRLIVLVKQLRQDNQKMLIFSERLATSVYIAKGLQKFISELRVANTVKQNGDEFLQKEFSEVQALMLGFAPISNSKEGKSPPEDRYDVLITTDAYSQGVNLQDASIVIHYDIAWTPDIIIQRAGRILRFWTEPRTVQFYLFVGSYQLNRSRNKESLLVQNRFAKLTKRNKEAEKITEIPIIPEDTKKFETLRGLSSLKIENLGSIEISSLEDERFEVSTFLTHLAQLKINEDYAKNIPDDISSAMVSAKVQSPYLYILLKRQKKFHWMLYNIAKNKIERIEEDHLLDRISCTEDTPIAFTDSNVIEEYRKICIDLWCNKQDLDEEERQEIRHICSMYLLPDEKDLRNFLGNR